MGFGAIKVGEGLEGLGQELLAFWIKVSSLGLRAWDLGSTGFGALTPKAPSPTS